MEDLEFDVQGLGVDLRIPGPGLRVEGCLGREGVGRILHVPDQQRPHLLQS